MKKQQELATLVAIYIFFVNKKPEEIMIKTLSILCVFIFNAFAQCARIENNLNYTPDHSPFLQQATVECVVTDKPDYFAPSPLVNDFSAVQTSGPACTPDFSCVYTAILSRYNAFCKTVMARQSNAYLDRCRCILIAYVKAPHLDSPEDDPLSAD